ncbi:MAG: peptidylprolyl isomerase [Candidatus Obscuribacterales bacterium]|nr:peptidylprolyl isomerase [Steroidobacteraceae bacterium]
MKRQHLSVALPATLLASLLLISACAKTDLKGKNAADNVATVNGKPISKALFDTFATVAARRPAEELNAEQREQMLEQLINMQLAADRLDKSNEPKSKDLEARLQFARMNVLMETTVKKYIDEHPTTDAELKAEYDTLIATMGREYHARHILVESKAVADNIIQQLKAGGDFAKIAAKESTDGSAKQGGDLNWFSLGQMAKPFADAVATLEKGKFTQEPVQTQFGWHVIKLEDFRSPSPAPFEEVKEQVRNVVQRKKIQAFIDDLRKTAKIEKHAAVAAAPPAAPAPAEAPKQ